MGRSTKYPNETLDERKARQRFATKQRVQKSRLRQKEMKALAAIQLQRAQEANCVRLRPCHLRLLNGGSCRRARGVSQSSGQLSDGYALGEAWLRTVPCC